MRKRFGDWGAELSEADFACALAAYGVLYAAGADFPIRADVLRSYLRDLCSSRAARLAWSLPFQSRMEGFFLDVPAGLLAEAWQRATIRGAPAIAVQPMPWGLDRSWVVAQLSRPEVGASEVYLDSLESERSLGPRPFPAIRGPVFGSQGVLEDLILSGNPSAWDLEKETPSGEALPRFLQVRLWQRTAQGQPRRVESALRPEGMYHAEVRIGLSDDDWMSVREPFPTPEETPEPKGHRLLLVFWEPRVSPEPQIQRLWLPSVGSSESRRFSFRIGANVETIAARITVFHANRVLQTGLLRASVRGKGQPTFELDATPRTRLEGLADRSLFDVSLVLDHDDEVTPHLTAASGDKAVVLSLDDGPLRDLTELLGRQISKIADDPDRYEGLESPGSVELLRSLARVGATVHDHLCRHTGLVRLADARRIHITSAKAESFLPAELLYRFRPPSETAVLCPHALEALAAGDCGGDCPADKRQTVCPLGFWGLSRVIERHAHRAEDQQRISGDFELRAEPVRGQSLLALAGSALLAASDKTTLVKKDAVTQLLDKLRARGRAELAKTWMEWEEHIRSDQPRLLILLPHHARDAEGFEFLEIGEKDRLGTVDIWDEKVRVLKGLHPVVLLMGCETNLTRISFDNPVSRFQDHGAAVVVSTIATILGRHASPATAILVELLDGMADGASTLGDVMLRLRRRLVAQATPMALGLTSYGDADWILARRE
jgi:hypothetical protein